MANTVNYMSNIRAWIQDGGAGFRNPLKFAGVDRSTIQIEGAGGPVIGGIDTGYEFDPYSQGQYVSVGRSVSPPDNPEATVKMRERTGGIPYSFLTQKCGFSVYELVGQCADPSDFLAGWEQYVMVYPNGIVTNRDYGNRSSFSDDGIMEHSLSTTWEIVPFQVGRLSFGVNQTLVGKPSRGIVYAQKVGCNACGFNNDGTNWLYQCNDSATGAKPGITYSTDGGVTWTEILVSTAANDEDFIAIAVLGSYLIAVSKTAGGAGNGGYYVSTINQYTGIPSSTFTKITSGFVASKAPNAVVTIGSSLWFAGDGGYIYQTSDPLAGVVVRSAGSAVTDNLVKISGTNETIVATGNNGAIIVSDGTGLRWAAPASAPTGAGVIGSALAVKNKFEWFTGHDNGTLYGTTDAGNSWTQIRFSGDGAGKVTDIIAANSHVLYFAHQTAAPLARIFASWNGGKSFTNVAPRISNLTTFSQAIQLAIPPKSADPLLRVNYLAVAGLAANGTDGITQIGAANFV